jgi:thioredoxin reductase (NADPH)
VKAGLEVVLLDRGGLCDGIRQYPTDLQFFTTRERLEIAGVPFAIPDAKPNRRQALAYYREVARQWNVPLALHETVTGVRRAGDGFEVTSTRGEQERRRRTGAGGACQRLLRQAAAAGRPRRGPALGVVALPRALRPLRRSRRRHRRRQHGGGGGARALPLAGAGDDGASRRGIPPGVKYWLKPDLENRIAEGSIAAHLETTVEAFVDGAVEVRTPQGRKSLPADAAYVLIGYLPELELARQVGVTLEPETLMPRVDPETCESDVPSFFHRRNAPGRPLHQPHLHRELARPRPRASSPAWRGGAATTPWPASCSPPSAPPGAPRRPIEGTHWHGSSTRKPTATGDPQGAAHRHRPRHSRRRR